MREKWLTAEEWDAILMVLLGLAVKPAAILLHVYTVCLAYAEQGIPAAIASLLLPGISQLYWVLDQGAEMGWTNPFNLFAYAVAVSGLWLLGCAIRHRLRSERLIRETAQESGC